MLPSSLNNQFHFPELKGSRVVSRVINTRLKALFECYGEIKEGGIAPSNIFIPVCLASASNTTSTKQLHYLGFS
jgi:hypothetical protein